jgi:hypothetical protein
MTDPGQLADNLETTRAHLETLWRQVQGHGLYDAGDWRQALATIEELVAAAARVDPEIVSQLREILGWFAAGDDGSPPLPCPKTSRAVCSASARWPTRCGHLARREFARPCRAARRDLASLVSVTSWTGSRSEVSALGPSVGGHPGLARCVRLQLLTGRRPKVSAG